MALNYDSVPNIKPSFSENTIAKELDKRNVVYVQEVIFDGLINPDTGAHLRFDFYLPVQNIIIEYDGVDFHSDVDVKRKDGIKNRFAKNNGIKMYRISGIRYIHPFINKKFGPEVKDIVEPLKGCRPVKRYMEQHILDDYEKMKKGWPSKNKKDRNYVMNNIKKIEKYINRIGNKDNNKNADKQHI